MEFDEKLQSIVTHFNSLGEKLLDPEFAGTEDFASISKEYADLNEVVEQIHALQSTKSEMQDLSEMLADESQDADMHALAEEEFRTLKESIPAIENRLKILLLPKDEADAKNAIIEIRAGTGGEEAALFAAELFTMYQRYAEKKGWKFEVISLSETGIGGYKEAQASISGKDVFSRLKFESGVHRVQRVPETESGGRIHTSAATVAVLPEAEDVDIHIEESDIRIDVFRASGPGGQSVNTTDSAVRITHIPTGLVVSQQDEKSQHKNRAKALKVLRARLYELERQQKADARAKDRKSQVGSGDRSERIRTYNFPQGRVTDHRINLTLFKMDEVLGGELDEFIEALITEDQALQMAESFDSAS